MQRSPKSTTGGVDTQRLVEEIAALKQSRDSLLEELAAIKSSQKYRFLVKLAILKAGFLFYKAHSSQLLHIILVLSSLHPRYVIVHLKKYLAIPNIDSLYQSWLTKHTPSQNELEQQKLRGSDFTHKPTIAVICLVTQNDRSTVTTFIEHCRKQTYANWQLFLVGDEAALDRQWEKHNPNIFVKPIPSQSKLSSTLQKLLEHTESDYTCITRPTHLFLPNAFYEIAKHCNAQMADIVYTDHDVINQHGKRTEPFFKPDFSYDMFLSYPYIGPVTWIKTKLIQQVGGFKKVHEEILTDELLLRVVLAANTIVHIPTVLYSVTNPPQLTNLKRTHRFTELYRHVMTSLLQKHQSIGEVLPGLKPNTHRVQYKITRKPLISIIIPTKDKVDYVKTCVSSVLSKTTYQNYEVVIIDTGSTEEATNKYYQSLQSVARVRILYWRKPFNYAAVNNYGVNQTRGEFVVLLNNDTQVISEDWLEAMLEHAQRPEVGAVGAKLYYTNKLLQHTGVVLGMGGGSYQRVAGHVLGYYPDDLPYYLPIIVSKDIVRDYSAVTAACLMVKKSKYLQVKGMSTEYKIAYNDIDFCLKLVEAGYRTIYTPYATLFHHESVSVGKPDVSQTETERFLEEIALMHRRWGILLESDPYFNPNYALNTEVYTLQK